MDLQTTSLDLLQSDTQLQILNDIDKLRGLGIKDLISLPQIVVCGDTSSGKSSLLQTVSGVSFPVGSDICTKFATELILRRCPTESATARISPPGAATKEHRANVSTFGRELVSLDRAEIEQLIDDAKKCMGIKDSGDMSDDVLRLTISGPMRPNLTLVDLPGIIHSSGNQADVKKIDSLVRSYMKEPRSMILVVVSGSNPIANQKVLSIAHEYDPDGARSIGVLTKPDLLDFVDPESSSGQKLLELAQNGHESFKYQRPWHVLRCPNPSERHDPHFDQQSVEQELFSKAPWNDFDRSRLGVENLRNSLCDYLLQQVRLDLPGVISEIRAKIRVTTHTVEELGQARSSSGEQRRYLTHISRRYEQLVRAALAGDYLNENEHFFAQQSTRLRAELRNLTDAFEVAMRTRGHTNTFSAQLHSVSEPGMEGNPQIIEKAEALKRAGALIKSYRGSELPGMFNPNLVSKLFKEQSVNWGKIAREYSSSACLLISKFISRLLKHICPTNSNTANLLLTELFDRALHEREQVIEEKITELMTPYTIALPFSTKSRLVASLRAVDEADKTDLRNIPVSQLIGVNDVTACSQLLQWSRAYYNVALENFVDNIVTLGIENCVAGKLPHLFSSDVVAELSDQKLHVLGGESSQISSQRVSENRKLDILRKSLETCSKYVDRELELKNKTPKGLARELKALSPEFQEVNGGGESSSKPISTTPPSSDTRPWVSPKPRVAAIPTASTIVITPDIHQENSQAGIEKKSKKVTVKMPPSPTITPPSLKPAMNTPASPANTVNGMSKPVGGQSGQPAALPGSESPHSGTVASNPASITATQHVSAVHTERSPSPSATASVQVQTPRPESKQGLSNTSSGTFGVPPPALGAFTSASSLNLPVSHSSNASPVSGAFGPRPGYGAGSGELFGTSGTLIAPSLFSPGFGFGGALNNVNKPPSSTPSSTLPRFSFGGALPNVNNPPSSTPSSTSTGFGSGSASLFGASLGSSTPSSTSTPFGSGSGLSDAPPASSTTSSTSTGSGLFGAPPASSTPSSTSTGSGLFGGPPTSRTPSSNFGGFGSDRALNPLSTFSATNALPQISGYKSHHALGPQNVPPANGTGDTPFSPTIEREWKSSTIRISLQSIVFQQPYQKYSFEELRLADYTAGRRFGVVGG